MVRLVSVESFQGIGIKIRVGIPMTVSAGNTPICSTRNKSDFKMNSNIKC